MKKTMLKTAVAALAAAMVSSVLADRTYDQPGTTTFTSAETESGYVKIESSSGAFDSDWQVWTTDGTEGAGLTLTGSNLCIADSNGETGRLKVKSGTYVCNTADWIYNPYTKASFGIGLEGGVGHYWQTGGSVTASDNLVVVGGSKNSSPRGVGSFRLDGGSFVNSSSSTHVGWGHGSGTFVQTGGSFETADKFQIVENYGDDSSATVSKGRFTVGGELLVGNGAAGYGKGTFTASGDAKVTAAVIKVGSKGSSGIFNLSDNASVETGYFVVGTQTATATCNMTGGTLTITGEGEWGSGAFPFGWTSTSSGTFVQSGGDIIFSNGAAWGAVGHSGSGTSSYTMTGGTFYMNPDGGNATFVIGRNDTAVGTLSVSGTATLTAKIIQLGEQSGASGTVNLGAGGTIAAKYFTCPAGTGIVNWNGGTLKALDSNSAFIPSRISLSVGSNGAVLDANGKTITIAATFPGGASAPLVLKSATGAVTLSEVTSGEKLYVNFSVPEDFPDGTYDVPSVAVTTGNEIEYAATTLDGKFNLVWNTTANTVTISATETNTAVRKVLVSDWKIQDSDETDLSGTAFAMGGYVIDLNGHDLTLGSWTAASGALVTNSSETAATLILATSADQASGNNFATFGGNLAIKVCGSNTTTFNPELTNTHTGGWIFENNDYNVQIKYHTDQMGTGPVVFNGNGGFTPYYAAAKDGWYEEHVRRNIEVHGEGNVFMSTMNADYNEFLRYAAVTGDGELTVMGTKPAECFSDNNSNFHGKIILGGGDMYVWGAGAYDFTNAVFRMDAPYSGGPGTTRMFARSGAGVYRLGDLCTASAEYNANLHFANFSAYGGNAAPVWYIGYRNADSVFAAQIFDGNSFVKVGTGTWTLNSYMRNTGSVTVEEGRVNFKNTANATVSWVVNSNGTLGGNGTIKGTLTVNGTVAPGSQTVETLTVEGAATFNSGAKLAATFGTDGASSCLALTGDGEVSIDNLRVVIPDATNLRHGSGYTYTLLTAENGSITGMPRFASGMRTSYGADGSRWILSLDGSLLKLSETTMGFAVIIR